MKIRKEDMNSLLKMFDKVLGFEGLYKEDLNDMVLYFNGKHELEAVYLKDGKEELVWNATNDFWYHYEVEE